MCVKHDDDDEDDAPASGMKERRETQKKNRVCFGPEKCIFTSQSCVAYVHRNTITHSKESKANDLEKSGMLVVV